jgi:Flp pilus assembly pilin Flp
MIKHRSNRRGQGMTEYIILVGILALLLIAAVNKFAFAVDEAIQGSANAFVLRYPAADYVDSSGNNIDTPELGVVDGTPPRTVYAVPVDDGSGGWKWSKRYGTDRSDPEYSPSDGPITSGRSF